MKFTEIKALADGTTVRSITGRCIKVYDPMAPTPGQAKHGFHPQSIILQDDEGENLMVRFNHENQHLDRAAEGHLYHFQSVAGDGKLEGLTVNKFKANNGEEKTSIQVAKQAHYYEVDESQASSQDVVKEKTKKDVDDMQKSNPDQRPQITPGSLVALYAKIMGELESQLEGTKVFEAMLKEPRSLASAASGIYIEACKQGLQFKMASPVVEVGQVEPEPKYAAAEQITLESLAKHIISGDLSPEELDAERRAIGTSWDQLWDECMKGKNYPDNVIEKAWDYHVGSMDGKPGTEEICRDICLNWKGFAMVLETQNKFGGPKGEEV